MCVGKCRTIECFFLWASANYIAICCVNFPFSYYRYEIGRLDAVSWQRWNENLRLIAASPFNTIAANNRYDQVGCLTIECTLLFMLLLLLLAIFLVFYHFYRLLFYHNYHMHRSTFDISRASKTWSYFRTSATT